MSNGHGVRLKPGLLQYGLFCYGRRLPDSMHAWVIRDLAGPGAARRMMIRVAIPAILILGPIWLIPMSLYLHASMTLPIFIPFVFFSHALNKVWRRHMLAKHGLDPDKVDDISRQKNAHVHQTYAQRYGPRPTSSSVGRPPDTAAGPTPSPGTVDRPGGTRDSARCTDLLSRARPNDSQGDVPDVTS